MFAATFSELLTLDIKYPSTSSCNRDPDEFQELGQSRKLQQFNDSLGQLNHKLFVSPDIDRNPIRLRARAHSWELDEIHSAINPGCVRAAKQQKLDHRFYEPPRALVLSVSRSDVRSPLSISEPVPPRFYRFSEEPGILVE